MAKIQPVVFPILGTATKLSVTVLGFSTKAKTANTYYQLLTEQNKQCIDGNYQLTEAQFAAWGVDNSYVDNAVATKLGVVIVPEFIGEDVDNGGGGVQAATLGFPPFLS
jgi:hypothetical protein